MRRCGRCTHVACSIKRLVLLTSWTTSCQILLSDFPIDQIPRSINWWCCSSCSEWATSRTTSSSSTQAPFSAGCIPCIQPVPALWRLRQLALVIIHLALRHQKWMLKSRDQMQTTAPIRGKQTFHIATLTVWYLCQLSLVTTPPTEWFRYLHAETCLQKSTLVSGKHCLMCAACPDTTISGELNFCVYHIVRYASARLTVNTTLSVHFISIRPWSDHRRAAYPSPTAESLRRTHIPVSLNSALCVRSLFQYGPGAIIGELDFFLQRPRSFVAHADGAVQLLVLSRAQFERMAREAPALTTLLQVCSLLFYCLTCCQTDSLTIRILVLPRAQFRAHGLRGTRTHHAPAGAQSLIVWSVRLSHKLSHKLSHRLSGSNWSFSNSTQFERMARDTFTILRQVFQTDSLSNYSRKPIMLHCNRAVDEAIEPEHVSPQYRRHHLADTQSLTIILWCL